MFHFTKQERQVLLFLSVVLFLGTALQFCLKKYPRLKERIDFDQGQKIYAVLDLNDATAADLDTLPCIGKTLARRIIIHRDLHGGFENLEELKSIKGVSPIVYEQIFPYLKVFAASPKREE